MYAFRRDDNKQLSVDGLQLSAIADRMDRRLYIQQTLRSFTNFQNAVASVKVNYSP